MTTVDLTASPSTTGNRAVSVQNLFYLNNVIHDILYSQGFNEAAGNFQGDNFGKGGAGGDPVLAEAQDGGGTDNANFATPTDGKKPRMQMYLWSGSGPTHEVVVNSISYGAKGAEFGPAMTTTGVTGAMAATTPADGCTTISTVLTGKVALIDRGTCTFTVKVLNAQTAGATAVVIANNQGGTDYFVMGGTDRKIRIPAVMVSQNDGTSLKAQSSATATVRKLAAQPLQIDGSIDADIVFHEYGHGLTWRMIGGMSGPLAGAIGEGMSDGLAMLVNGDDVIGEYSYGNPLGIRRYRYEGYPLTYADVDWRRGAQRRRDLRGHRLEDDGAVRRQQARRPVPIRRRRHELHAGDARLRADARRHPGVGARWARRRRIAAWSGRRLRSSASASALPGSSTEGR